MVLSGYFLSACSALAESKPVYDGSRLPDDWQIMVDEWRRQNGDLTVTIVETVEDEFGNVDESGGKYSCDEKEILLTKKAIQNYDEETFCTMLSFAKYHDRLCDIDYDSKYAHEVRRERRWDAIQRSDTVCTLLKYDAGLIEME